MNAQQSTSGEMLLKQRGGQYLKQLREDAEFTQRELADKVGLKHYSFISGIENGNAVLPSDLYPIYAEVLGVPVKDFIKRMLMYNKPVIYNGLWGLPKEADLKLPPRRRR